MPLITKASFGSSRSGYPDQNYDVNDLRLICLDALQVVEADARHQADLELVRPLPKVLLTDGK